MKRLLILGAGTAGTIMANKLAPVLDKNEWEITLVDQEEIHYYQPGFLFIPFGMYNRDDVIKPKRDYLPREVRFILSPIEVIEPEKSRVKLSNRQVLSYDVLIVATGSRIRPEETEGLMNGGWHENIFDFYTLEGAAALRDFLKYWRGGTMVLNIVEMPIKCPVAPLEFVFLADWWFTEQGMRDRVEIKFVTPLPEAFTKPRAAKYLNAFLEKKNITLIPEFDTGRVESGENKIVSWDEQEIQYDLLITIPTNMGDDLIKRSGMGDDLNFIPTQRHSLQAKNWENVFVIGDATDLPSSKAGSVAHFQAEVLFENILRYIDGCPLLDEFDGHAKSK